MPRRFGVLVVGVFGAWLVAAGCAASGSTTQVNGPAYDLDGGGSGPTNGDGAVSADGAGASSDATTPPLDGMPGDSALSDATPEQTDANGSDASDANSVTEDSGGCTLTTALFGGNGTSLFGATAIGTGAFASQAPTGNITTTPALAPFGGGFQALFTQAGDAGGGNALFGIGYAGGTWSAATALGGSADAIGAPSVAAVGSTLQAVYLNPAHFYFQASFGTAWNAVAEPVQLPNDGGPQAFGPVAASSAGTATEFVIAYEGNNNLPYAQTWTVGAGWDDGVSLGASLLAVNTGMAIVALDSGPNDLLAVYVEAGGACTGSTGCLYAVLHTASPAEWSSPALVNTTAYSPSAPTLTAMSGGRALLAWRGGNGEGYESVYSAGAWSTPAQLTSATVTAAPSLAQGVCGDDAVAAYVSSAQAYTTHFAGGAWTTPAALPAGSGATLVAIATSP